MDLTFKDPRQYLRDTHREIIKGYKHRIGTVIEQFKLPGNETEQAYHTNYRTMLVELVRRLHPEEIDSDLESIGSWVTKIEALHSKQEHIEYLLSVTVRDAGRIYDAKPQPALTLHR
jgi:hypothetical protein